MEGPPETALSWSVGRPGWAETSAPRFGRGTDKVAVVVGVCGDIRGLSGRSPYRGGTGLFARWDDGTGKSALRGLTRSADPQTAGKIFWHYVSLLVFPSRLSVDYSYNAIPVSSIVSRGRSNRGCGGGSRRVVPVDTIAGKDGRGCFFVARSFWVPYAGVSQTVLLLNSMVQERFLYIPVLGLFALAGVGVDRLFRRYGFNVVIAIAIVVGAYAGRTVVRNGDWKDDLSLFSSAVRAYPESAKMHQAVGQVYAERGLMDRAILAFRRALSIREEAMTYNNLGNAYGVTGAFVQAAEAYRKAVVSGSAICRGLDESGRDGHASRGSRRWPRRDSGRQRFCFPTKRKPISILAWRWRRRGGPKKRRRRIAGPHRWEMRGRISTLARCWRTRAGPGMLSLPTGRF